MLRHGGGLPASPRIPYILITPSGARFAVRRKTTPSSDLLREPLRILVIRGCGERAHLPHRVRIVLDSHGGPSARPDVAKDLGFIGGKLPLHRGPAEDRRG